MDRIEGIEKVLDARSQRRSSFACRLVSVGRRDGQCNGGLFIYIPLYLYKIYLVYRVSSMQVNNRLSLGGFLLFSRRRQILYIFLSSSSSCFAILRLAPQPCFVWRRGVERSCDDAQYSGRRRFFFFSGLSIIPPPPPARRRYHTQPKWRPLVGCWAPAPVRVCNFTDEVFRGKSIRPIGAPIPHTLFAFSILRAQHKLPVLPMLVRSPETLDNLLL